MKRDQFLSGCLFKNDKIYWLAKAKAGAPFPYVNCPNDPSPCSFEGMICSCLSKGVVFLFLFIESFS